MLPRGPGAPGGRRRTCRRATPWPRPGRTRSERGVAAVEAGLIVTFLSPLLVGTLFYGTYFWKAQQLDAYTPTIPPTAVVGTYLNCVDLLTKVRNTVLVNSNGLGTATELQLDDITATVVDHVPERLGVDVLISVRVPVVSAGVGALLPNGGDVVTEALTRLESVRLDTQSC